MVRQQNYSGAFEEAVHIPCVEVLWIQHSRRIVGNSNSSQRCSNWKISTVYSTLELGRTVCKFHNVQGEVREKENWNKITISGPRIESINTCRASTIKVAYSDWNDWRGFWDTWKFILHFILLIRVASKEHECCIHSLVWSRKQQTKFTTRQSILLETRCKFRCSKYNSCFLVLYEVSRSERTLDTIRRIMKTYKAPLHYSFLCVCVEDEQFSSCFLDIYCSFCVCQWQCLLSQTKQKW